jgi:tetratricopeptide (TPR) repeat protein
MLDESERTLFRRLAVFAGGCTLEAVEAVCNADGDLTLDVFDGVCSLVDKNLLRQRDDESGEPRFWMLETIREYSKEQLESSGEATRFQTAHAAHFLELAETAHPHLSLDDAPLWVQRLQTEQENLRTAFEWSLHNEPLTALRLAHRLYLYWSFIGRPGQGAAWIEQSMAATPDAPVVDLCSAILFLCHNFDFTGQMPRMAAAAKQLLHLSRQSGLRSFEANALGSLSITTAVEGDVEGARQLAEQALTASRDHLNSLGTSPGCAQERVSAEHTLVGGLVSLADRVYLCGQPEEAIALYTEAFAQARRLSGTGISPYMLNAAAAVYMSVGRYAEARDYLHQSLQLQRDSGNRALIGWTLHDLGKMAIIEGDFAQSRSYLTESIRTFEEQGSTDAIAWTLLPLCWLACAQSQWTRAALLLGMEKALRAQVGREKLSDDWTERYAGFIRDTRAALGENEYIAAHARGRSKTVEEIIEYSLKED